MECNICFEEKENETVIPCERCNFGSHFPCLLEWQKVASRDLVGKCPLCRKDLRTLICEGTSFEYKSKWIIILVFALLTIFLGSAVTLTFEEITIENDYKFVVSFTFCLSLLQGLALMTTLCFLPYNRHSLIHRVVCVMSFIAFILLTSMFYLHYLLDMQFKPFIWLAGFIMGGTLPCCLVVIKEGIVTRNVITIQTIEV